MVQWSNAPLLVFHQCMDREWTSWGLDSARQFAKAGFAVIRVKSEGWRDLKEKQPNAFRTPYIKTQTEQQMICTIVMRDITCPLLLQVMTDMNDGTRSKDLRTWNRDGLQIELPPGDAPCVPRLDVVAVTEASAWLADDVTPAVFRALYNLYSERLVWAGFNGDVRSTGSKLVLGEPHDFSLLKEVFERLKVYHIDQQYKSFQNKFFSIVWSKTEIVVGSREHVSGCCDRNANADKMQAGYKPKPRVYDILKGKTKKKVKCPLSPFDFIASSLINYEPCRHTGSKQDTVALRMWSYLLEEGEHQAPSHDFMREFSEKIEAHRQVVRISSIDAEVARAQKAKTETWEDAELKLDFEEQFMTGEPPLSGMPSEHDVFLHIKNTSWRMHHLIDTNILAMCHRGLCVKDFTGSAGSKIRWLSCRYHATKKFAGAWQAIEHFTKFQCHLIEERSQALLDVDLDIIAPNVSDEDAALPSEPREHAALPSVPTGMDPIMENAALPSYPTDSDAIDAYSRGLMFMQWVAYPNADEPLSPALGLNIQNIWPSGLVAFADHCRERQVWLSDVTLALDEIMEYSPMAWRGEMYLKLLRRKVKDLWPMLCNSSGPTFLWTDFELQMRWYWSLNHWAQENCLCCKFVVQKPGSDEGKLKYRAQGRMLSTRYKDRGANKRSRRGPETLTRMSSQDHWTHFVSY